MNTCLDLMRRRTKILIEFLKLENFQLRLDEQPELLRPLIGYDLYQLDPDSGEIKEYSSYFSPGAERQYWMEIVDLSYDIAEILFKLKQGSSATVVKNLFNPKIVYLAEVGHDLSVQRNIIRRELQRNGYTVLPTQTLPNTSVDIRTDCEKRSGRLQHVDSPHWKQLWRDTGGRFPFGRRPSAYNCSGKKSGSQ